MFVGTLIAPLFAALGCESRVARLGLAAPGVDDRTSQAVLDDFGDP